MKDELLNLTEELMRFETTKEKPDEIRKSMDYVKKYFSGEEFKIREYESNGKQSMVVSFKETKTPEVLLHGHIDVVSASEKMFEPEVRDGKIYGRGSGDMKAGLACLMKLMKDFQTEKPDIALMVVSDEEIGGFNGAKHLLEEENYRPSFVITAEPNSAEERGKMNITLKQKGVVRAKAKVKGKSAHGSRPWRGENAAEKMMDFYQEKVSPLFPDSLEETWKTTCNLGMVEAGQAFNVVPDTATMSLDIRWSNEYPGEEVLSDLQEIEGIEITDPATVDPMLDTEPENKYVQKLQRVAEETIGRCELVKNEQASDGRHFSDMGIPAVVFGPEGYNAHETDEYVVIESLGDYVVTLEKLIERLN